MNVSKKCSRARCLRAPRTTWSRGHESRSGYQRNIQRFVVIPPSPTWAHMRPQTKPFTVETKSRRRSPEPSHGNRSAATDEPSPDDLPSRDVREDAADTPFWAASQVFSAFTSNAISTASTLGDLTTSVFTPKPPEQPAKAPAIEEGRTGRILPSLLPPSPFETASAQDDGPVRKTAKTKRPRKRALEVTEQQETPVPTEAAASPAVRPTIALELSPSVTAPSLSGRKANGRRADARVRAGEGWKRRRLPKACW